MKKIKLDNENLKVGEKVWVCSKAKDFENGWCNSWPEEMNKALGNFLEILSFPSSSGILLDSRSKCDYSYRFPLFVLSRNKKHVGKIAKIYEPKWKDIWK